MSKGGAQKYHAIGDNLFERPKARYIGQHVASEGAPRASIWQWVTTTLFSSPRAEPTAKHWIAKVYVPQVAESAEQQEVEEGNQKYYTYFLRDQLLDSYISRLCHACISFAPKGKMVDNTKYVSRLYPLDHQAAIHDTSQVEVKNHDLYHVLTKASDEQKELHLKGIVKALVFNIIVENWDNKLGNYTAYPEGREGKVYKVAPFDFPFSLQTKGRYKSWDEASFNDLLGGVKDIESQQKNVAAALAETIGELGEKTSSYYSEHFSGHQNRFSRIMDRVTRSIHAELDAINKDDHSQAVITVFKELLSDMKHHKDAAYEKVSQDINDKLTLDSGYLWVRRTVRGYHAALGANLEKFGEFVTKWEENHARPASFALRMSEKSTNAASASLSGFTARIDGERQRAKEPSTFHRQ